MQAFTDVLPVLSQPIPMGREEELLQGFVELADRLLLGDSFVALQPLDDRAGRRGHSIGKLSLPTPRRAFHQQRFLHARREISYFEPHRINHVSGRPKLFRKLTQRTEHFNAEPYSGKSWTPNFGEREPGQAISGGACQGLLAIHVPHQKGKTIRYQQYLA